MPKKYIVDLTPTERDKLQQLTATGEGKARMLTRARILLKSDAGWPDQAISDALDCGTSTVERTRKRFAEVRLDAINREKPDRDYDRKLDGDAQARLVALACGDPPVGRSRWTLRLLAEKLVELDDIEFDSISHEAVRQVLKKRPETVAVSSVGDLSRK